MTQQIPAGWYPDPAPASPGAAPLQRWWDGTRWTEHVRPVPGLDAPAAPQQPAAYGGRFGEPAGAVSPYGAGPVPAYAGAARDATTPDGEPLAGWWMRVAAYLIDGVLVGTLAALLAFRQVAAIGSAYADFFRESLRAAENGTPAPGQGQLLGDVAGPLVIYVLVTLGVQLVYHAGFLKTLAATPGKLALGLRVRRREAPGPLSWGTVLRRWLGQYAPGALGLVPLLGVLGNLYRLLDGLWPLWDAHRQALHDKLAGTNVVRRRR